MTLDTRMAMLRAMRRDRVMSEKKDIVATIVSYVAGVAISIGIAAGSIWFALWAIKGLVEIVVAIRGGK